MTDKKPTTLNDALAEVSNKIQHSNDKKEQEQQELMELLRSIAKNIETLVGRV